MPANKSHSISVFLNQEYPSIVKSEGIYLYDDTGKRYVDASSGPILCSLGYGNQQIAEVLKEQALKTAYVFRMDFTSPELEECCTRICQKTNGVMDRVFMVSGGSEATESAIKLARKYQIDSGNSSKFKVISRWLSYHGMTMGSLALSGFPFRRADYVPYVPSTYHIPPAYCYRCWFHKTPDSCELECAQALENEIMMQGPETVAAFIAEPFSGMSLCAAAPRKDYFNKIRKICDKFGVLLILDEVMTGFGRTGKFFAYEHYETPPDLMALGKGIAGGYFPLGAVAVTAGVADAIANGSGTFASGHTWAGNPLGAAVANKTMDLLDEGDLVRRCSEMGDYLALKLEGLRTHPIIGDIRGTGLMRGVEFVKNKETREPLDPALKFWLLLHREAQKKGLVIETSGGCERGQAGDMMMLGPAFIVGREEIDNIIDLLDEVLWDVEKKIGF
ncbi:MAG: aminotransferase class III-fold pyridoxal phosphate-dependent enzyme [Desulfobacterales bacterium]|jgi:adenosylmethionine-8-amino-7-oxononanoate aminotransferase